MKRFRLFAGPNGSGKSTLIEKIAKEFPIGFIINADKIEKRLNQKKFLDCRDFLPVSVTQSAWEYYLDHAKKRDSRILPGYKNLLTIDNDILVVHQKINSYIAAIIAAFFRKSLLNEESSFSFETVLSHPSKIAYLKEAKKRKFKTYLYYISTLDPSINSSRVNLRVGKGGHDVSEQKIEERYYRSLSLLFDAFHAVDRAFIMDNSADKTDLSVVVEKKGKEIEIYKDNVPQWIDEYLLSKL